MKTLIKVITIIVFAAFIISQIFINRYFGFTEEGKSMVFIAVCCLMDGAIAIVVINKLFED